MKVGSASIWLDDVVSGLRGALFVALAVVILLPPAPSFGTAAGVHALFNLETQAGGPFPSDRFTAADASQNTRLRVNLPKPNCQARPSDGSSNFAREDFGGKYLNNRFLVSFR